MNIKTPASLLPDSRTLGARLAAALDRGNGSHAPKILERRLPAMMSTFPNEIVSCQLGDGTKQAVFIKYQSNRVHEAFGHRGGIAYEAAVYRALIQPMGARPRFLAAHTDSHTGETWAMLEYIPRTVRVSDIVKGFKRQPVAMKEAAGWIARFHSTHEPSVGESKLAFLKRYDADYYRGWAERMFEFSKPLRRKFPWLAPLQRCGNRWFAPLLRAPQTVIHGEFYSKTLLLQRRKLFVIDWESAAIAPGEIDLAALIEGNHWRGKIVAECEAAYRRARWPEGPPGEFQRRFTAAKMYLHFRWLGEREDWALREKSRWRYQDLYRRAKKCGLL